MRVEHSLKITAICPVDGKPDVYRLVVRTTRTIPVEEIWKQVELLTKTACFQEDLTQALFRALACEVETRGWHGAVRTVVACGGKS